MMLQLPLCVKETCNPRTFSQIFTNTQFHHRKLGQWKMCLVVSYMYSTIQTYHRGYFLILRAGVVVAGIRVHILGGSGWQRNPGNTCNTQR